MAQLSSRRYRLMLVGVADTHAVIWYLHADPRLSSTAKDFIEATATNGDQIGLSSITLIEMVYLNRS